MTADEPPISTEPVATGDRRDEVRFESDPDQLVRMRATFKPEGPIPPEMVPGVAPTEPGLAVEDVVVAPETPSVWDARPADDSDRS